MDICRILSHFQFLSYPQGNSPNFIFKRLTQNYFYQKRLELLYKPKLLIAVLPSDRNPNAILSKINYITSKPGINFSTVFTLFHSALHLFSASTIHFCEKSRLTTMQQLFCVIAVPRKIPMTEYWFNFIAFNKK